MITSRLSAWIAVDWAVAAYVAAVGVLAIACADAIPQWPALVSAHAALLVALVALPPRVARWEVRRSADPAWLDVSRRTLRFLRYTYPVLLLTPFFEEVRFTVNAVSPNNPYWFEPYLYAADRALLRSAPAAAVAQNGASILDELMHAFYFSYYPMIAAAMVVAWFGMRRRAPTPAAGFHRVLTATIFGFFSAYVWYPFLPARGPWENAELMAGLRKFEGFIFTPLVQWLINNAGVPGGCFPSAHVAGTWALVVGLAPAHRQLASWFSVLAVGLSISCVYTHYHHTVDVFAGFVVGVGGGLLGLALSRRFEKPTGM